MAQMKVAKLQEVMGWTGRFFFYICVKKKKEGNFNQICNFVYALVVSLFFYYYLILIITLLFFLLLSLY